MVLDSNIIIYSVMPEYTKVRSFLKEKESELKVSAITKLEVLGYHKLSSEDKELFEGFFQTITVLPVSNYVIENAIILKQQRIISLGDSLIAATALLNNEKLFTNNVEDFSGISGLSIIPLKSVLKI